MSAGLRRSRAGVVGAATLAALMVLCIGQARAAVYPAGGGSFTGSAEGWRNAEEPACNIGLGLCTATAGYDGAGGNPPGSLAATTTVLINVGGLFKSTAVFESPDFTATEGGPATLSLDRQLATGSLLDLTPSLTYTATLIDRTAGDSTIAISEAVSGGGDAFVGKDGATKLVAGHTYAIAIDAETSSSVANLGLLGAATARFDNVSVTVGNTGGPGGKGNGGGGNGGGGLTNGSLASLMQGSLIGPAILKGKRVIVKVKCPAKVGRACKVGLQGLLKKGRAATSRRSARIGDGKTKRFVLQLKPKARAKVIARKRLLFKETVKAGKAKATVYKRLKLIKR